MFEGFKLMFESPVLYILLKVSNILVNDTMTYLGIWKFPYILCKNKKVSRLIC